MNTFKCVMLLAMALMVSRTAHGARTLKTVGFLRQYSLAAGGLLTSSMPCQTVCDDLTFGCIELGGMCHGMLSMIGMLFCVCCLFLFPFFRVI